MLIDDLCEDLRKTLSLPRFPVNDRGGYSLFFDPDLFVDIAPIEEGFCLTTQVGKIEDRGPFEEFFSTLMFANLLGQGTHGAILSLDSSGHEIHLTREWFVERMANSEFQQELETFLNYAEYWKKEIEKAKI